MKEIKTDFASHGDPRFMFKHQTLVQDYQGLRSDTELKISKLEMVERKKLILEAEVKFLRRRFKQLIQEQTPEASSPMMLRLSQSGKRKNHSGLTASLQSSDLKLRNTIIYNGANNDLENKPKRSRGDEVLTLPDLNGSGNTFVNIKVPGGFDLNQISREEDEPAANGDHMVAEGKKNAMVGNGINDLHGKLELPVCRDVEKEMNRATVKRKVSWQDPVALSV